MTFISSRKVTCKCKRAGMSLLLMTSSPHPAFYVSSISRVDTNFIYPKHMDHVKVLHLSRVPKHNHQLLQLLPGATSGKLRLMSKQSSRRDEDQEGGSIFGASLLFAGTAIGAGMLALPSETMAAGFIPSSFCLILCCVFTYVTSMIVLEANWVASCDESRNDTAHSCSFGSGFLSISRLALGVPGEIVTAALFWFLLTSIIVAYVAEGGHLISHVVTEVSSESISPEIGSLVFASFFASLATYGTSRVDTINRVFVLGLVVSFICLVGIGLPMVEIPNLTARSNWESLYPTVVSIGILSFGAQNVVPTLLNYLGNDPKRTRQAILYGTLMPLAMYLIWEAVFIGIIGSSTLSDNKMEVITVLGQEGGTVSEFVEFFSICAVGSSMAGASISLVDFFNDAFTISSEESHINSTVSLSENSGRKNRLFPTAIGFGPPVLLAYFYPGIFLSALEEAGLIGGLSLYGILPALSLLALRQRGSKYVSAMPGSIGGNKLLCVVLALSSVLLIPEIYRLGFLVINQLNRQQI